MSSPGFFPESTKRVMPRWAKKVIGKARIAMMIRGIMPPTPALIGRNKTPAPIAVPYRPSIHMVSVLRHPLRVSPETMVLV